MKKRVGIFVLILSCLSLTLGVISSKGAVLETKDSKEVKARFDKISFENGEVYNNYDTGSDKNNPAEYEIVDGIGATDGNKALKVVYGVGSWPGINFYANNGEAWDFGKNGCLSFDVTNPMDRAVQLCIKFDCSLTSNVGQDAVFTATIPAGKTTTINTATSSLNVQLGMLYNPPSKNGTQASYGWGNGSVDYSNIKHITFWINGNTQETTLIFDNLCVKEDPNINIEASYSDLVDKYGQYTQNDFDGKIKNDSDFIKVLDSENAILDKQLKVTQSRKLSTYFGFKDNSLRQKATGSFYTKKINGKWMLIDPQGYPYVSTGIDIVRLEDASTWVSGREFMFDNLPSQKSDLGDHYTTVSNCLKTPMNLSSGLAFNFYTANLERKYGDQWKRNWIDNSIKRFKAWGFSSMGCWSDPQIFYGKGKDFKLPYVTHAWLNGDQAKLKSGGAWADLSDPFDPKFRKNTAKKIKEIADMGVNEDPWCMGIYVDNEIAWGNASVDSQKYAVITGVFQGDASEDNMYAKKAFIKMLKSKYKNISALNKAWGTSLTAWKDMEKPYSGVIGTEDASLCLSMLAGQYYKIVSEEVNKRMPNILYLGSRLAEWGCGPEVIQACAKYADVVSFNCYKTDINQDFMQLGTFDKPVIIGEFHFNSSDRNNFAPGLVPVGSQSDRAAAYIEYMTSVFKNKYIVGAHWFQYYDQPTLGRAFDGENSNCGFVDVTDQPYTELVDVAKKINEKAYDIRLFYIQPNELKVSASKIYLSKEKPNIKLKATVNPKDAYDKSVTWVSNNNDIVTVSSSGMLTAHKNGKATITVTTNDNKKLIKTCLITVSGFADEIVTFPSVSFEDGEPSVFIQTDGRPMSLEYVNNMGVTDGTKACKVNINELVKDSKNWNFCLLQAINNSGWNIGSNNSICFDVTNPNPVDMQLRVNIIDNKDSLRTYYFPISAEATRNLEVNNFSASGDVWLSDGYYGAPDGLDTSKITNISFYLWETKNEWVADEKLTSALFIIDNIRVKDNSKTSMK